MSGNEILLNMKNSRFFRDRELIYSLKEFSKRVIHPANRPLFQSNYSIFQNPLFANTLGLTLRKIQSMSVYKI